MGIYMSLTYLDSFQKLFDLSRVQSPKALGRLVSKHREQGWRGDTLIFLYLEVCRTLSQVTLIKYLSVSLTSRPGGNEFQISNYIFKFWHALLWLVELLRMNTRAPWFSTCSRVDKGMLWDRGVSLRFNDAGWKPRWLDFEKCSVCLPTSGHKTILLASILKRGLSWQYTFLWRKHFFYYF